MPTYEYECEKCGHNFELFQSMSEDPVEICPVCKKKSVRRLIFGGIGVIFKGDGFYVTDSKKNQAPGRGQKDGKDKKEISDNGSGEAIKKPENPESDKKKSESDKTESGTKNAEKGKDSKKMTKTEPVGKS